MSQTTDQTNTWRSGWFWIDAYERVPGMPDSKSIRADGSRRAVAVSPGVGQSSANGLTEGNQLRLSNG